MADHYEVGDQLEHQTYGACTVVGTETESIGGQALAFVALQREDNGAKVLVPLAKMPSVVARKAQAEIVRLGTALVLPSDDGAKSWQAKLEGVCLVQSSATARGKARETRRTFSSQPDATAAFHEAVRRKMNDGFLQLRDARAARAGDIVLRMAIPNEESTVVFDLSPDGRTLAFAVNAEDRGSIHFIDINTGKQRLVHEPAPGDGATRWPVEALLFDGTGRSLIFSNHSETRHLDLETGKVTVIASFNAATDSAAALEVPSWDAPRRRLLVFDCHDRIRVVDSNFQTLLEVTASPRNAGSYRGVLAPSGEKLALQLTSPDDASTAVEIWSIASRSVLQRVRLAPAAAVASFDATETKLLLTTLQDVAEVAIDTGAELWRNPEYPGQPAPSRDRRRFILHRYLGLSLFDEESKALSPLELESTMSRFEGRTVWSDDGSLLAVGSGSRDLTVYRM